MNVLVLSIQCWRKRRVFGAPDTHGIDTLDETSRPCAWVASGCRIPGKGVRPASDFAGDISLSKTSR